jgi:hypothetical protein
VEITNTSLVEFAHEAIKKQRGGFSLDGSVVSALIQEQDGLLVEELATDTDVYDGLLFAGLRTANPNAIGMAVVSTGWAAPLNTDGEVEGAPSAHPERRRVRLTAIATKNGQASLIEFADDEGEYVIDEGQATGSLADALASAWDSYLS